MKSSFILTSLCATLAVAGPFKRNIFTHWEFETVTVTVTGLTEATSAPDGRFYHGGWGGRFSQSAASETVAPVPTTTPAVVSSPPVVVVPVTPSSSAAAPAASSNTDGLDDYAKPILEQHNLHRANHSSPMMSWDSTLASIAKQIAESCVYEHNTAAGGGNYGQNIGAGAPGSDVPKMITNDMYNGEVNYYPGYGGEPDMSAFENWGHFSQIVWADTTSVGCYTAHCPNGLANTGSGISPYFTVCNYRPVGNFAGRYGKNVLKPKGDATVVV